MTVAETDLKPEEWAGYRAHSRRTGALVVLVDAEPQGLSPADGGRWVLICDDHSTLIQFERQSDARYFMTDPENWCEMCAGTDNREDDI